MVIILLEDILQVGIVLMMISSVYRPIIDPRDIRVDYPNLRSDIGTYYGWGF